MSVEAKIYEGVVGLLLDCLLFDKTDTPVPVSSIAECDLRVLVPGSTTEITWEVTKEDPNILRYVIPQDAIIVAGKYKIQPYIETTDGFKGRWGTVEMVVSKAMSK